MASEATISEAERMGREAFNAGASLGANPFSDVWVRHAWSMGWLESRDAYTAAHRERMEAERGD